MNVLFVCTGNTCRSPMAEGYLKHLLKVNNITNVNVISAGTHANDESPASEESIKAMNVFEIDISTHKSKLVSKETLEWANLIVGMTYLHVQSILTLFGFEHRKKLKILHEFDQKNTDVVDPFGGDKKIYMSCFEEMKPAIDNIFAEIVSMLDKAN